MSLGVSVCDRVVGESSSVFTSLSPPPLGLFSLDFKACVYCPSPWTEGVVGLGGRKGGT